ncbi:MAG: tRNA threonylcarbamoyladenosine dehydratase [Muribaculaceae bacterium]|nr:tRNA threonylcarbamoyladenosine dehydratase [Muribaculaceae bacterium]
MQEEFSRTELLLGAAAMQRLAACRIAVFGVGGVGGYVVEALARSGVGTLDVFDTDVVSISNLNRQVIALHSTLGRKKVEVAAERVRDINPQCQVTAHDVFYLPANADGVDLSVYDYVVDCIDTVSAKMELARRCTGLGVPFISSMGAAYKMDPMAFRVMDFAKTNMDPLAKVMRKRLRKEGTFHFKCVCSTEKPQFPAEPVVADDGRKCPASNAFVPAAAGLLLASEVIKDLTAAERTEQ